MQDNYVSIITCGSAARGTASEIQNLILSARLGKKSHRSFCFLVVQIGERVVQDERRAFSEARRVHGIRKRSAQAYSCQISPSCTQQRGIPLFSPLFHSDVGVRVHIDAGCGVSGDHLPVPAEAGPDRVRIARCHGFTGFLKDRGGHCDVSIFRQTRLLLSSELLQFRQHRVSLLPF